MCAYIYIYFTIDLHRYTITMSHFTNLENADIRRTSQGPTVYKIILKICHHYDLTRHMNRTCHTLPNTKRTAPGVVVICASDFSIKIASIVTSPSTLQILRQPRYHSWSTKVILPKLVHLSQLTGGWLFLGIFMMVAVFPEYTRNIGSKPSIR